MDVELLLSGERGLRTLLHGSGRALVRRMVQDMAGGDRALRSLRLGRTHYKPGRKLATYFEATFESWPEPVPISVTWLAQAPSTDRRAQSAEEEIIRRGIPTPLRRMWSADSSGALQVLAAPLDPVFPSLPELADPLQSAPLRVRFARYRPGQRHVLAYADGSTVRRFAKLYRPGESAQVVAAVGSFAQAAARAGVAGVRVVAPSAVLTDLDAIVYERMPGRTLSSALKAAQAVPEDRLRLLGRWLRTVHSSAPSATPPLSERTVEYEAQRVMRACAAMAGLRPDLAQRARSTVERAAEQLAALEAEPPVLVHGDMKADHILCAAGAIAILDTDSSGLADPALDLGKLLADLHWWASVSGRPQPRLETAVLAGYNPDLARLARARLYTAMLLVKMAARRLSVARREWGSRTVQVLDLAAELLEKERTLQVA